MTLLNICLVEVLWLGLVNSSMLSKIYCDTLQMTPLRVKTAEPKTEIGSVLHPTIKIMLMCNVSCIFLLIRIHPCVNQCANP